MAAYLRTVEISEDGSSTQQFLNFHVSNAVCFSGEETVQTVAGPKRMDRLELGDEVNSVWLTSLKAFRPRSW